MTIIALRCYPQQKKKLKREKKKKSKHIQEHSIQETNEKRITITELKKW